MRSLLVSATLLTCVCGVSAESADSGLVDGDFETTTPGHTLPSVYGTWGFDFARTTGPVQGIEPLGGDRMLQFLGTGPLAAGGDGSSADLWQLVELDDHDETVVRLEVSFNRVDAGPATDTVFVASVRAYAGAPGDFAISRTRVAEPLLAAESRLSADDDAATWETIVVETKIPADAEYLAVHIGAIEDQTNELRVAVSADMLDLATEFAGHFADAVTLTIESHCPADVTRDGVVGLDDFAAVLGAWGTCAGCPAELDGTDGVDLGDALVVFEHWGACAR